MITERLRNLLPRRRQHDVVLYGKPGCHLCDDARALLARTATRRRFTLSEIDIRADPALFRLYDVRIPVLLSMARPNWKHRCTSATSCGRCGDSEARN